MKLSLKARNHITCYTFLIPFLLPFVLFVIYPVIKAFYISLFDYTPYGTEWAGFGNYALLMKDPNFWKSLVNTFSIVLITVPSAIIISFFIALTIMPKNKKAQAFYRAAFYIPVVTSTVAISLIWRYIYDENFGLGNYIVTSLGLDPVQWLSSPSVAIWSICIVIITFSIGGPTILYTAALAGIPKTYYEVGEIEGANAWNRFIQITVPLVKPTTLYNVITGIIGAFQVFAVVLLMTGGGPNYATSTISLMLYKTAFAFGNYGLASAVGVILFIIIAVVSYIQFKFLSTDIEY